MSHYSYKSAQILFTEKLKDVYLQNESIQFIKMIFEHYLQFQSADFIMRQNEVQNSTFSSELEKILIRLLKGEPIQYIIGEIWFYDLKYKVTSSVLIPRQETEELVDWIVKETRVSSPTILDIGTGSGCIAISLKNSLKDASVEAWDVSIEALETAKLNAGMNNLELSFRQVDILSANFEESSGIFDVVVSNPPYVMDKEKRLMQTNVLDHEPHLALFVDDDDPLLFYRVISKKAYVLLRDSGSLFFEINEALGSETVELLKSLGYKNIELRKDINGKDRMIKATKN